MYLSYRAAQEKAVQQYDAAFHLLKVTYPLVRDPKLLMGVLHNLLSSLEHSMDAVLAYERQLQLIPAYRDDFQDKFNLFRLKCVRRNNLSMDAVNLMIELRSTVELHKKSPMEFERRNQLIICDKSYQYKSISVPELQKYLLTTKQFIDQLKVIIRFD